MNNKIKTEKKKINDIEIDVKSTSTDVDVCNNPSCSNLVTDFQYFEQNGFCLDCYRGVKFKSEEEGGLELNRNCDSCNTLMTESGHFYCKGICYDCYSIEFKKLFPNFPF